MPTQTLEPRLWHAACRPTALHSFRACPRLPLPLTFLYTHAAPLHSAAACRTFAALPYASMHRRYHTRRHHPYYRTLTAGHLHRTTVWDAMIWVCDFIFAVLRSGIPTLARTPPASRCYRTISTYAYSAAAHTYRPAIRLCRYTLPLAPALPSTYRRSRFTLCGYRCTTTGHRYTTLPAAHRMVTCLAPVWTRVPPLRLPPPCASTIPLPLPISPGRPTTPTNPTYHLPHLSPHRHLRHRAISALPLLAYQCLRTVPTAPNACYCLTLPRLPHLQYDFLPTIHLVPCYRTAFCVTGLHGRWYATAPVWVWAGRWWTHSRSGPAW